MEGGLKVALLLLSLALPALSAIVPASTTFLLGKSLAMVVSEATLYSVGQQTVTLVAPYGLYTYVHTLTVPIKETFTFVCLGSAALGIPTPTVVATAAGLFNSINVTTVQVTSVTTLSESLPSPFYYVIGPATTMTFVASALSSSTTPLASALASAGGAGVKGFGALLPSPSVVCTVNPPTAITVMPNSTIYASTVTFTSPVAGTLEAPFPLTTTIYFPVSAKGEATVSYFVAYVELSAQRPSPSEPALLILSLPFLAALWRKRRT